MQFDIHADSTAAAGAAAKFIADAAAAAIAETGRFVWAVSGGSTPASMLSELAGLDVDWSRTHLFQVDERIAAHGDSARNDTMIRRTVIDHCPAAHYYPLPVEAAELGAALADHLCDLETLSGQPVTLDLVQLGLGTDGHTASLVPDDPVLGATTPFAVTEPYQGTERVTMTAPLINQARQRLFFVTGDAKRPALRQLAERDHSIPATLITEQSTTVITDQPFG